MFVKNLETLSKVYGRERSFAMSFSSWFFGNTLIIPDEKENKFDVGYLL
jgi:hypothetical protein